MSLVVMPPVPLSVANVGREWIVEPGRLRNAENARKAGDNPDCQRDH